MKHEPVDLAIVGGGAAGLMAAATARSLGLNCLVIERKARIGSKMLMTANGRCNFTKDISAERMLADIGEPVASFVRPALRACPPEMIAGGFRARGLKVKRMADGRLFPASEKAADVVHVFGDLLRDGEVPLLTNSAVTGLQPMKTGFIVALGGGFSLWARNVLLATGGASFPKTGSVGDGQRLARELGHRIEPLRAALTGFEVREMKNEELRMKNEEKKDLRFEISDLRFSSPRKADFSRVEREETRRDSSCSPRSTRRNPDSSPVIPVSRSEEIPNLKSQISNLLGEASVLVDGREVCRYAGEVETTPWGVSGAAVYNCQRWVARHAPADFALRVETREGSRTFARPVARPLKEAIVTMGGVARDEVDPRTMASRLVPGLYFAGEVLDIDGPTGGYNLSLAFATARLAVTSLKGSV